MLCYLIKLYVKEVSIDDIVKVLGIFQVLSTSQIPCVVSFDALQRSGCEPPTLLAWF